MKTMVKGERVTLRLRSRAASVVGVLVPLGELEENHSLVPIIDIVEHTVGSDSEYTRQ